MNTNDLQQQKPERGSTNDGLMLILGLKPATGPLDSATTYRVMPVHAAQKALPADTPYWRVELQNLGSGATLGLDIVADAVVGRGPDADIDLGQHGGADKGVSRRHIILRPTRSALYLVDLGSTNGTRINGLPLGRSEARALQSDAIITLGKMTFTLKIAGSGEIKDLAQPEDQPAPPPEPARGLEQATTEMPALSLFSQPKPVVKAAPPVPPATPADAPPSAPGDGGKKTESGDAAQPVGPDDETVVSKGQQHMGTADEVRLWLGARAAARARMVADQLEKDKADRESGTADKAAG